MYGTRMCALLSYKFYRTSSTQVNCFGIQGFFYFEILTQRDIPGGHAYQEKHVSLDHRFLLAGLQDELFSLGPEHVCATCNS